MSSKLWEDVKKGLKETVSYAAEKTEELTTIGRIKMDVVGLKRTMESKHKELGKLVYAKFTQGKEFTTKNNEEAREILKTLTALEKDVKKKEAELAEVGKKSKEAQAETKAKA